MREEVTVDQFKALAGAAKRPRRSGATPAASLTRACLGFLALRGALAWRNNTTGVWDPTTKRMRTFQGLKGVADILAVLPGGRFLAVEVKAGKDKPSADQRAFLEGVQRNGGLALVVRDVRELVAELGSA